MRAIPHKDWRLDQNSVNKMYLPIRQNVKICMDQSKPDVL